MHLVGPVPREPSTPINTMPGARAGRGRDRRPVSLARALEGKVHLPKDRGMLGTPPGQNTAPSTL